MLMIAYGYRQEGLEMVDAWLKHQWRASIQTDKNYFSSLVGEPLIEKHPNGMQRIAETPFCWYAH